MASCSEITRVSSEETQSSNNKATKVTHKVFSTKRPQESKAFKRSIIYPTEDSSNERSLTKIAKISPTKLSSTKGSTPKATPTKSYQFKWVDTTTKQRDSEVEKLKKNLQKCQDELREEVEKRGTSSAGRAASERDRGRMLGEIKQLGVSKRRLESALETSLTAVKRLEGEVKAVREACKQQVVNMEKASALEVKKLLEDLKSKDQMLASLDRNQYSDRSVQLKIVQQKQQQQHQQQHQQQLQQLREQLQQELKEELEGDIKKEIHHKLQQEMQQKVEQQLKQQHQQLTQQLKTKQHSHEIILKQQKIHNNANKTHICSQKSQISKLEAEIQAITNEKNEICRENKKVGDEKRTIEKKLETLKEENDKMSQTLSQLQEEVSSLHESLADTNVEGVLRQFEDLKRLTEDQKSAIDALERGNKKNELSKNKKTPAKVGQRDKKSVTFLLPESTKSIVNGRVAYKEDMRFLFFDDGEDGDDEEEDDGGGWHDNDDEKHVPSGDSLSEGSLEIRGILATKKASTCDREDFTKLMNDHLRLQQAYTNLSNKKIKEWVIEREALNLAIIALEGKNQEFECMTKCLALEVEEINDKNEELEFQVLELEGCRVDAKGLEEKDEVIEDLSQKNRTLESQVTELSNGIHLMNEQASVKEAKACKREQGVQCGMGGDGGKEVDVVVCSEFEATTMMTTTTTSGIEDISSDDDEASIDSILHDNETSVIPCYDEARPAQESEDPSKKLLKVVENLELRLACSKLRENNLLDKIALLCEEKKRLFLDAFKGEESMVDEYVVIEKDLDRLGCSVDGDDGNDHSSEIHKELYAKFDKFDGKSEQCDDNDDSVDARKVAAKLKMKISLDKSTEGCLWIEECLRLDTPTKDEYSPYIQSLTGEDENEVLHQKMLQLEKDCYTMREIVDLDEGVIREFQIKVFDLENSERALQTALDKLEGVEKALRKSKEELEDENERLRREVSRMKTSEESLQSNLDISQSNENQLKKKLEEVSQDLKETEKKLRKKCAVSEKLEERAIESSEKFEDQLGELESVIELFKKRNSNLERLCEELNGRLMEAEKQARRAKMQAECMEQQRDTFVNRIHCLEKDRASLMEKVTSTNRSLEEKTNQAEMVVVEVAGLRACLEVCEAERDESVARVERQRDVELLLMRELEALKDGHSKLQEELRRAAQDNRILSINSESQTSFDSYQEECSEHYNDCMKVSLTLLSVKGGSESPESILCSDDDDLYDYDYDKYGPSGKYLLRRTKSLNDINFFACHKVTQTTPMGHRSHQGLSFIPIHRAYLNQEFNILSHPPYISHPFSPIYPQTFQTGDTNMASPALASH